MVVIEYEEKRRRRSDRKETIYKIDIFARACVVHTFLNTVYRIEISRLISEFRFISFLAVFTVFDCQHVFDAIMVP